MAALSRKSADWRSARLSSPPLLRAGRDGRDALDVGASSDRETRVRWRSPEATARGGGVKRRATLEHRHSAAAGRPECGRAGTIFQELLFLRVLMGFPAHRASLIASVLVGALVGTAAAQPGRQFSAADYDRAVRMLGPSLNSLVIGGNVNVNWLSDDRFWYRNQTAAGYEFVLVDPAKRTRSPAFDHAAVAAALSAATGGKYSAGTLPFQSLVFSAKLDSITIDAGLKRWSCDVKGRGCVAAGEASRTGQGPGGRGGNTVLSPDGKRAAFLRDWNLWVRE